VPQSFVTDAHHPRCHRSPLIHWNRRALCSDTLDAGISFLIFYVAPLLDPTRLAVQLGLLCLDGPHTHLRTPPTKPFISAVLPGMRMSDHLGASTGPFLHHPLLPPPHHVIPCRRLPSPPDTLDVRRPAPAHPG